MEYVLSLLEPMLLEALLEDLYLDPHFDNESYHQLNLCYG